MPDQQRDERIALNESRFREINDRVRADLAALVNRPERVGFVCECGRFDCRAEIVLSDPEYEAVREDPMTFVVAPGHELPEAETVVGRSDRFTVVRKHENVRAVTERTDPRAPSGGAGSG